MCAEASEHVTMHLLNKSNGQSLNAIQLIARTNRKNWIQIERQMRHTGWSITYAIHYTISGPSPEAEEEMWQIAGILLGILTLLQTQAKCTQFHCAIFGSSERIRYSFRWMQTMTVMSGE